MAAGVCAVAAVTVNLSLDADDVDPPAAGWLDAKLAEAAAAAGVAGGELNVLVVDDAAMASLHADFSGDPTPTDVLTFDLTETAAGPAAVVEGDIAVCRDVAARRAAERGHPVREELLLYAVHGLLHLLGEDDHDPAAFARMHAREDAILSAIGVGPRFAAAAGGPGAWP